MKIKISDPVEERIIDRLYNLQRFTFCDVIEIVTDETGSKHALGIAPRILTKLIMKYKREKGRPPEVRIF
jgi:hypothetical protein